MHRYKLGADLLERRSIGKNLRILGDNRLAISQQCALRANNVNDILEYIRKSVARGDPPCLLLQKNFISLAMKRFFSYLLKFPLLFLNVFLSS